MKKGLKVLAEQWTGCMRCGLGKERTRPEIVFGWGKSSAKYLLLYDAPSAQDEIASSTMVGMEGELLGVLLQEAHISIDEVYCTPLVGCRPTMFIPDTADKQARYEDREPNKDELHACRERVTEIIYRIDPRVIFTFGTLPYKALVRTKDRGIHTTVDKAVGELFVGRLPGRLVDEITYDVIPLLSMRQIMASPSSATHGPLSTTVRHLHKGKVFSDFLEKTHTRDNAAAGFAQEGQPQVGTKAAR